MKARAVRGVARPILPFCHLHRRPFPEGWWRLDVLIEKLQDIYTKMRLWGENGVPRRSRSTFVAKVSQRSSTTYCRCQIHSAQPPMSFVSVSLLTRIWCSVQVACKTSPGWTRTARTMPPEAAPASWPRTLSCCEDQNRRLSLPSTIAVQFTIKMSEFFFFGAITQCNHF